MTDLLNVTVADGKYTVVQYSGGGLHALRYDEPWRDCVGDGLILALAQEVLELRGRAARQTEPVAWRITNRKTGTVKVRLDPQFDCQFNREHWLEEPLYTAPPATDAMREAIRIPLHQLQADIDYLVGRVAADGSCSSMISATIKNRLAAVENALKAAGFDLGGYR